MSDMYSKRPASQSPQSSEIRDTKRPTGLQANDLLSDAEHQQCDKQVKDYFEGIGLTISLKNPAQKALLLSSVVASCPSHALMNPTYKIAGECARLLAAHPYLDNMLQHGFESGSYNDLRNLMLLRKVEPVSKGGPPKTPEQRNRSPVEIQISPAKNKEDVTPDIQRVLRDFETSFKEFLTQDMDTNEFNPDIQLVLMNGLGRQSVDERIKGLFSMYDRCIFNTSGSGKTTLMLNGLCSFWGFYIVTLRDQQHMIGSFDLTLALEELAGRKSFHALSELTVSEQHQINETLAINAGYSILLARLIVFNFFLDIAKAKGLDDDLTSLKRKWTLLQIDPQATVQGDIFRDVSTHLFHVIPGSLSRWIEDTITKLGPKIRRVPLYLILDEAQRVTSLYDTHFRGETSVLKYLLRAWQPKYPLRRLLSGTGLSLDIMYDKSLNSSNIGKPLPNWELFTDTGYFDDRLVQADYIVQHAWPELSQSKLSLSQRALLDRCWRWLRGRYRFTTAFVRWLRASPLSPHRVLDMYIQHFTKEDGSTISFHPTDGQQYAESEPKLPNDVRDGIMSVVGVDWSRFHNSENDYLRRAVITFIMTLTTRTSHHILYDKVHQMVSLGIAMVAPSKAVVAKVIGGDSELALLLPEPLAIAGALMAFKQKKDLGIESYVATELGSPLPAARGAAFELAAVIMLALNLDGSKSLRSIFHFASEADLGPLLDSKARLVSLLDWQSQTPIVCPAGLYHGASPLLSFTADSPLEVENWSKGNGIPFLLPDKNMGPDVVALVQVGDKFVWLFCQAKIFAQWTIQPGQLKEAVRSTAVEKLYSNKNNAPFGPKKYPTLPKNIREALRIPQIPVLRAVISYPAVVKPGDAKGVAASSTEALAVLKDPEDLLEPDSALLSVLQNTRKKLVGDDGKLIMSWDEVFAGDQ